MENSNSWMPNMNENLHKFFFDSFLRCTFNRSITSKWRKFGSDECRLGRTVGQIIVNLNKWLVFSFIGFYNLNFRSAFDGMGQIWQKI